MPKRLRDEADYQPPSADLDFTNSFTKPFPSEDVTVALVRMVITRESRNLKTRKDHIGSILKDNAMRTNLRFKGSHADHDLRNIFGISAQFDRPVVDVGSCLPHDSRTLLQRLLKSDDGPSINVKDQLLSSLLHCPDRGYAGTLDPLLLAFGGVLMLTLCILVINEGKISETALLQHLARFGVPSSPNLKIPNFNIDLHTFIQDLVKRDFVVKRDMDSIDSHAKESYYELGLRLGRDFSTEEFKSVFEAVMGERETWSQKIDVCLERCFLDL